MLRERVLATHMGRFSGPKFSKQGFLSWQIFLKRGCVFQKLAKMSKTGSFPPKFVVKLGITATVGNKKRAAF